MFWDKMWKTSKSSFKNQNNSLIQSNLMNNFINPIQERLQKSKKNMKFADRVSL